MHSIEVELAIYLRQMKKAAFLTTMAAACEGS